MSACPSSADEGDVVNLYGGVRYTYDNNLLRLPDGVTFAGSRSDSILSAFAGVTFDKLVGRQRFRGDFSYYGNSYNNFKILDYDAPAARATWLWRVGNQLSGEVGFDYRKSLTDFRDFGVIGVGGAIVPVRIKNITTNRKGLVNGSYLFHPDWSAVGSFDTTRSENDSDLRRTLDLDKDTYELGADHRRPGGNLLGVRWRYAHGVYVNREFPNPTLTDKEFDQNDLALRAVWLPAGHSRIEARGGWTWREHPNVPERDFSGPTGRLTYDWQFQPKSKLTVSAGREINEYELVGTSYVDQRSIRLAPTWSPTAKISLEAGWEYLDLRFAGDTGFVAGQPRRRDRIDTGYLGATYAPWRFAQFSLRVQHDRRHSNQVGLDFDATYGYLSAQLTF